MWSFVKWWLHVNKLADRIASEQAKWESRRNYRLDRPQISDNKDRIATWVTYWPISVIWSLLDDFIKHLMQQLVMSLRKAYEAITNSAFKKFETPKQREE